MKEKNLPSSSMLKPNSQTAANHKRESLVQIILPAVVLFLLMVSGVVLIVSSGSAASRGWADVALIFLVLLILLPLLLMGVAFAALFIGVGKLYAILPSYMRIVQGAGLLIQYRVRFHADRMVAPFITLSSWQAALQECTHQARNAFRKR